MSTIGKATFTGFKKWLRKNAPTIIMGAGIGCYAGATAFTVMGTVKAVKVIKTLEIVRSTGADVDGDRALVTVDIRDGVIVPDEFKVKPKEAVRLCWKYYIPSMLTFMGGTALVITANHIQLMRVELLATALIANNKKFDEYKEKVNKVFGDDANKKIADKDARDAVFANPPPAGIGAGTGALLCMDSFTGQYFWSTRHVIDQAITECDRALMMDGRVSVNDLLYRLGANESAGANYCGWDTSEEARISSGRYKTVSESITLNYVSGPNDEPVLVLQYEPQPFIPF